MDFGGDDFNFVNSMKIDAQLLIVEGAESTQTSPLDLYENTLSMGAFHEPTASTSGGVNESLTSDLAEPFGNFPKFDVTTKSWLDFCKGRISESVETPGSSTHVTMETRDLSYSPIVEAPREVGTPFDDARSAPGPQERPDSCAIRAQQHVLALFGIDVSESDLVRDAASHGEYVEGDNKGTSLDHIGNLLERNGVQTHRYAGATLAHLVSELAQGHKVVVGVDGFELTAKDGEQIAEEHFKDLFIEEPNHAVVVTNVDAYTMDVDVVDPFDGKAHTFSAERFVDAWRDSKYFMVATDKSPEEFLNQTTSKREVE